MGFFLSFAQHIHHAESPGIMVNHRISIAQMQQNMVVYPRLIAGCRHHRKTTGHPQMREQHITTIHLKYKVFCPTADI